MKSTQELLPSVEEIGKGTVEKTAPHELADSVNLILEFTGTDPASRYGRGYLSKLVKRTGKSLFEVESIIKNLYECPTKMRGGAVTNRLLGKPKKYVVN